MKSLFIVCLLFAASIAAAQTVEISCVLVDLSDGEKDEYVLKFNDSDRSQILVDGSPVPRRSSERIYELETFGSSIVKWSTVRSTNKSIGSTYTVDRVQGSIERYSYITNKVTARGRCGRTTERKF